MASESLSQMIERIRPSIVQIRTGSGSGSAVIFNVDGEVGYIVTNRHVVKDNRQVRVVVNDSSEYTGQVVGMDDGYDLAFVRIAGRNLRAVPFGNSSNVGAGDEVVAIGYPRPSDFRGEATVTKGIVSAKRYEPRFGSQVIQSDLTVHPGNSGGPMLSVNGEILGINTYITNYDTGNAYTFAIPEATVRTAASRLSIPVPPASSQHSHRAPGPTRQNGPTPPVTPTQPSPSASQASGSTNRLGTYLKSFGIGFIGGAILGVAVASLALKIEGDLSVPLVVSGLIGGGSAVLLTMKIR